MDFNFHLFVVVVLGVSLTSAQRPPYVQGPLTYPQELPQYRPESSTLENKFGEDETTPQPSTSTVTSLPGSIYEQDLINRVPEWPEDKKPFWFINNQFIQNQTGNRPPQGSQG